MSQSLSPSWWPGRGRLCLQKWVNCLNPFLFLFPNTTWHISFRHIFDCRLRNTQRTQFEVGSAWGSAWTGTWTQRRRPQTSMSSQGSPSTLTRILRTQKVIILMSSRLIVLALTIGWFSFMCYIITRWLFLWIKVWDIFAFPQSYPVLYISVCLNLLVYFASFCCRVRRFVSDFCQSNKWHGSIGGR